MEVGSDIYMGLMGCLAGMKLNIGRKDRHDPVLHIVISQSDNDES